MSIPMQIIRRIDINAPLVTDMPTTLLMQGDSLANELVLELTDSGEPVSLTGQTASCYLMRQDGVRVYNPGTITGNVVTVPLAAECYSLPGSYAAFVRLTSGKVKRTIYRLAGQVEREGSGPIIDPSGTIPSYEDLAAKLQEMEEAIAAGNAATGQATAAAGAANAKAQEANEAAAAALAAKQQALDAAGTANAKAQEAAEAAAAALAAKQDALTAAAGANQAADTIDNMTAEATPVEPGGAPTVAVGEKDGHKHLTLGIPRGATGPQGPGYTIKGQAYATVAALQAAVPSPAVGDQYNVGAAAPYNVYRWTGSAWEDQGTIQGQSGQDGVSPTANVVKTGRTATIIITDADGTTTATVTDGLDGVDGADAPPTVHVGPEAPTGGETVWVKPGAPDAGTTGEDIPVSKTDATKIDVALMGKADAAETVAALAGKQAAITSDNAETVRAALGLSKAATAAIKTGSVYVTAAANDNVSQPFEFPEPFGVSLYGIVLTLGSGNPRDCAVAVSGATVTGFNAILGNASAAEVTARIFYFALGI